MAAVEGYVYPNHEVFWGVLIVVYPYLVSIITGMVTIYAISEFWRKDLKDAEKLILVATLPFVLSALLPLLLDLGQPQRAFEIYVTPNFSSVMAVFGIVYLTELFTLLGEMWFSFRRDIVIYARNEGNPIKRLVYRFLTLGVYDTSEEALKLDHRIIKTLTLIELIAAWCLSYVSFLFGVVKSNPWWNTTILPVSFVFGGLAAGSALVILVYIIACRVYRREAKEKVIDTIAYYLFFFLLAAFGLEMINTILYAYKEDVAWAVIKITASELVIPQMIVVIGSMEALLFLRFGRNLKGTAKQALYAIVAVSVLIVVFAMRWNMVVGAQLVDYSLRGYIGYSPPLFGREGLIAAIGVLLAPFAIMAVVAYFLPPFPEKRALPSVAQPEKHIRVDLAERV